MVSLVLHPDLRPVLSGLAFFCAYLASPPIVGPRLSPPVFFTIALYLAVAALRATFFTTVLAIALAIYGPIFLALDHIHGECGYPVMVGRSTWHRHRLGELDYYQQCVQSAQAFWLMVILALLWSIAFLLEAHRRFRSRQNRIKLADDDENNDDEDAVVLISPEPTTLQME
ncbi:MAG: hypothetical protein CYPHOPRED_004670 [Cyphobasidiales sp. Tagirdzhanova-0007]|nr:MAG: hypothetical protein CYPHOPRED_004670 [Cyphobasidiales sp. Tagirdzhanova-0007]